MVGCFWFVYLLGFVLIGWVVGWVDVFVFVLRCCVCVLWLLVVGCIDFFYIFIRYCGLFECLVGVLGLVGFVGFVVEWFVCCLFGLFLWVLFICLFVGCFADCL